ncbi:MAG: PCMD domain-containing protein [Rikenellaceae bacterium]
MRLMNFSEKVKRVIALSSMFGGAISSLYGQQEGDIIPVKYGDMEQWLTRKVEESFVIGGADKEVYEIEPHRTMLVNTAFKPDSSQWATSSVYAHVTGVHKASITVFPEDREGGGKCALLETRLETVKVLGLINISVLATGTIYLGETLEPVRDTKNPYSKIMTGVPFTDRPVAMVFDYKVDPAKERIYAPGFGKKSVVPGDNAAEAVVILQRRWEDERGNIYAKRIATGWHRFDKVESEWQNGHRVELRYGDISGDSDFKEYEDLLEGDNQIYSINSNGEVRPIFEVDWDIESAVPTHIIIRFSSGYGGAYIGSLGSEFWIDNVALEY